MERLRQQQEALRAAHQRNEKDLASFPQVLVEHPRYGRAVVRGGSNCQALEQAALLWGMTPRTWATRRGCGSWPATRLSTRSWESWQNSR